MGLLHISLVLFWTESIFKKKKSHIFSLHFQVPEKNQRENWIAFIYRGYLTIEVLAQRGKFEMLMKFSSLESIVTSRYLFWAIYTFPQKKSDHLKSFDWVEQAWSQNIPQRKKCSWQSACNYITDVLEDMKVLFAPFIGIQFLLWQDNARPHVAHITRDYLQPTGIQTIGHPPTSMFPDLNVFDHT